MTTASADELFQIATESVQECGKIKNLMAAIELCLSDNYALSDKYLVERLRLMSSRLEFNLTFLTVTYEPEEAGARWAKLGYSELDCPFPFTFTPHRSERDLDAPRDGLGAAWVRGFRRASAL